MGKYDGLVKYLGKEDSYSPDQVLKGLEAEEKQAQMNDMSNVTSESMDNIEKLINGSAFSSPSAFAHAAVSDPVPVAEIDPSQIDPEVLKELEHMDAAPPNISDIQDRLRVTNYDEAPPEGEQPLPSIDEETPSEESGPAISDDDFLTPQFRDIKKSEEPITEEPFSNDTVPAFSEDVPPMEMPVSDEGFPSIEPESTGMEDLQGLLGGLDTMTGETPGAGGMEGLELPEPGMEMETPSLPETPMDFPSFDDLTAEPSGQEEIQEMPVLPGSTDDFSSVPSEPDFNFPDEFGAEHSVVTEFSDISDHIEEIQKGKPVEIERPDFSREIMRGSAVIEMDADKAIKIRNRINKIVDPTLRKKIRQIFIENKLPSDQMNALVAAILMNEDEGRISSMIAPFMPDDVITAKEESFKARAEAEQAAAQTAREKTKRKVIYTEDTRKGKDFSREIQGISRNMFLIFALVVLAGFLFWRLIWVPTSADRYYNQGFSALQRQEYSLAEDRFVKGKTISGPNLKWYNRFGVEYLKQSKMDEAKKKFQEALDNDPVDKDTIYNYADYYKKVYPPKFDEAVKLYLRLLQKDVKNFEYLDKVGQTYVEWGDRLVDTNDQSDKYILANNLYENYLQNNPKDTVSFFRLLDIAIRLKNDDRIDTLYDSLDHVNKTAVNVRTFTDLARYYTDKKRLDRSKLVFNKLMQANPQYDESFYEYGRYLTINRDYLHAIQAVQQAVNLNNKNAKAYNLLGEIYFANESIPDNYQLAKKNYEAAIENAPNFFKPYVNLGHLYFYNNLKFADSDKALQQAFDYYKQSKMIIEQYGDPSGEGDKDTLLSYNLGWLYYNNKEWDSAFSEFSRLYVQTPYDPVVSYNMGNTHYHLNRLQLAMMEYDKAVEYYQAMANRVAYINPSSERHREIYNQLARSYNNRGVVYAQAAKQGSKSARDYEQRALLDFYRAKDSANKINTIYSYAEYNIKYMLNKSMRGREPSLDDTLLKRTTLRNLTDEFRENLIDSL